MLPQNPTCGSFFKLSCNVESAVFMNFLYSVTSKYIHFSQPLDGSFHACEIFETSHITFWKSFARVFSSLTHLTVKEITCVCIHLTTKVLKFWATVKITTTDPSHQKICFCLERSDFGQKTLWIVLLEVTSSLTFEKHGYRIPAFTQLEYRWFFQVKILFCV